MAIIKTLRYPINMVSMFEDPTPGSNNVFFQSDAYYKDAISPQYDQGINYTTDGTITTAKRWGYSKPDADAGTGLGGILVLNGECTHVRHRIFNTVNDYRNNLDWAPFASMDPTVRITPSRYFTDGYNTLVFASYNYHDPTARSDQYYLYYCTPFWTALNMSSTQLVQNNYLTNLSNPGSNSPGNLQFTHLASNGYGTSCFPVFRNPATNNLIFIANGGYGANNASAYGYAPTACGGAAFGPMFTTSPNQLYPSLTYQNRTNQHLGVSALDGYQISLHLAVNGDYLNYLYKFNDTNQTLITLANFLTPVPPVGTGQTGSYTLSTASTVATTSGWWFYFTGTNVSTLTTFSGTATVTGTNIVISTLTNGIIALNAQIFSSNTTVLATGTTITAFGFGSNAGGIRGTAFGNAIPKYASKTFVDPSTSTTYGFYVPHVDTIGNYVPIYYQWNRLTDTFRQQYGVTVTYTTGTSINTYWSPDTVSGTSVDVQYGMQRLWANETFVSSSTRYLMFMQLHGAGGVLDTTAQLRTFPTYRVDAADPTKLTYFSKIEVPATPKNICWLSDDRTIIGIITHSALYIFTFSASNGWTQTGYFPFQFNAVGRDNLGRVWGQDTGPGYGRIHLITLNVPVNIVVTSDASTYYYAGSVNTANLTVNAYSYTGARIATQVKLVIDGGSMTFAGNNLALTITTSASADTVVPVTITGGGVANIIASAKLN
jgi:hypothetical protein